MKESPSTENIDIGATVDLRWAKGPFELMNSIGIGKIYKLVEATANRYPDFKIPRMLARLKELGIPIDFSFNDFNRAVARQN